MADLAVIRPGQIWADNDKRCKGRMLSVVNVYPVKGVLKVECYAWYDNRSGPGRNVLIRADRFRPTSTGYRLVQEVDA